MKRDCNQILEGVFLGHIRRVQREGRSTPCRQKSRSFKRRKKKLRIGEKHVSGYVRKKGGYILHLIEPPALLLKVTI